MDTAGLVGLTAGRGRGDASPARSTPRADPADGLLDVTAVGPLSRRERVRQRQTVHRAARVESTSAGVTAYADGEPAAPLPAGAECVPRSAAARRHGPRLNWSPGDARPHVVVPELTLQRAFGHCAARLGGWTAADGGRRMTATEGSCADRRRRA